jgi:hypothetical protein
MLHDNPPVPLAAFNFAEYMLPSVAGAIDPADVIAGKAFTVIVIEADSVGNALDIAVTV